MPETIIQVRDLTEEERDSYTCRDCGQPHRSNDRLRLYTMYNGTTRRLHTSCFNRAYLPCHECGQIMYSYQHYGTSDEPYCLYHSGVCDDCGRRTDAGASICEDCGWSCATCAGRYSTGQQSYCINDWDENAYCESCYYNRTAGSPSGIRGYGHTHPTKWFGGPLPRDPGSNRRIGFYLGFELEITASEDADATPIHRWAHEHGMTDFFDCKEDSSVSGFEIATQPFTPAYFEAMVADGRLASFFDLLNEEYPTSRESDHHGLHVHIGRVAFGRDDVALAAFSYLLGQENSKHLERIARRSPTGYCNRVRKPVSTVLASRGAVTTQGRRAYNAGHYPGRNAINLTNENTIEIRAFKSTRDASELAAAVRLTYVGAEYVRYLRAAAKTTGVDPKRLKWTEFVRWAAYAHPLAFPALAGLDEPKPVPVKVAPPTGGQWSVEDFSGDDLATPRPVPTVEPGRWEIIDPNGCQNRHCCSTNFRWVEPRPVRTGLSDVFPPLPQPVPVGSEYDPF